MAKETLEALQVKNAAPGTTLNDGGGLYLRCTSKGAKRWVFRYTRKGHPRQDQGLGSYPAVTLKQARKKAEASRALLAEGMDPKAELSRRAAEERALAEAEANAATFGEYADKFVAWKIAHAGFSNPKHIYQWRHTFTHHLSALRSKKLADVTRDDILPVLAQMWEETHVTATRVRGRLEGLFDHAIQNGAYHRDNPARWVLYNATLSAPRKLTKGHRPAMPKEAVPAFMAELRTREGFGALALEFAILTAARSGEVRLATWREIDFERSLWTVPAGRMKTRQDNNRRDHVVPMTSGVVDVLERARALFLEQPRPDDYLFPGSKPGVPLSDMTLRAVLRRITGEAYTPHGFRAAFRTWAATDTEFPRELAEEALSHQLGGVERAYWREQAVERRRLLMEAWDAYTDGQAPAEARVVSFKGGA